MSLTHQHFQAVADALYSSMPTRAYWGRQFPARCRQWLADRDAIAHAMLRLNSRFNRSRFDRWTERGMSDTQWAAAERARAKRRAEQRDD